MGIARFADFGIAGGQFVVGSFIGAGIKMALIRLPSKMGNRV